MRAGVQRRNHYARICQITDSKDVKETKTKSNLLLSVQYIECAIKDVISDDWKVPVSKVLESKTKQFTLQQYSYSCRKFQHWRTSLLSKSESVVKKMFSKI